MRRRLSPRSTFGPLVLAATTVLALAGCGGSSGTPDAGSSAGGGDQPVAVTLITKDSVNPFWIAMQNGAKQAATTNNVQLTTAAGAADGDEDGQVKAIEAAVARGDQGILIAVNGPGVNTALDNARKQGLYVIALDTPPEPASTADITFATDNFAAGEAIGRWTAAQLGGKKATIALLDAFNDKIISVDYNRDQGFLTGMGIDTKDKTKNGDEDPTGTYPAARAATTRSSATSRRRAPRTVASRPWRPACRRTATSTSSTR